MISLKKSAKIIAIFLYFLLLVGVSGKLFFEQQFDAIKATFLSMRGSGDQTLAIGFSEPLLAFDPLVNDTGSRARLLHTYEALIRVTSDLQIESALAINYGSLDDFTWEFRLRPNVKFHNGQPLTVDDVIFSLSEARNNPRSGVKDLASTISGIQKIDEEKFQIITDSPDPLLLQKLSFFLIFPKDFDVANASIPIGTGPYKLEKNEKGTIVLRLFDSYWGDKPVFEEVVLKTLTKREEKITAMKNREVDILANLPADIANNFQYRGFELKTIPSLEVDFLMFHFDRTFKNRDLREAVRLALDTANLSRLAQGFSVPATQFVGDGIFGFNPTISAPERNISRAQELVSKVSRGQPIRATLDLPKGLEVFGENVSLQLRRIGMEITPQFYEPNQLGKLVINRSSEFFFFGWRSELADASDFLTAVVHSPSGRFGQYNGGNYRSTEADRLIELSQETLKGEVRLEKLRSVMAKITENDIIGIPLFSPEVLYGVSRKVEFKPRVDGYVLAQEVKL